MVSEHDFKDALDNKEKGIEILEQAIGSLLELRYRINIPNFGSFSPRDGLEIARADQMTLVPIPDELKRRIENASSDT